MPKKSSINTDSSNDLADFESRLAKLKSSSSSAVPTDTELSSRLGNLLSEEPVAVQFSKNNSYSIPTNFVQEYDSDEINALLADPNLLSDTDTDILTLISPAATHHLDSTVSHFLKSSFPETSDEESTLLQQALEAATLEKRHANSFQGPSDDSLRERIEGLRSGIKFHVGTAASKGLGPPPKPVEKTDLEDEQQDDDMKGWCCICNEDATMVCLSEECDRDPYCARCFQEAHSEDPEMRRHRWEKYTKKGRRKGM